MNKRHKAIVAGTALAIGGLSVAATNVAAQGAPTEVDDDGVGELGVCS